MRQESEARELTDALSGSAGYLLAQASRLLRERMTAALSPYELSLYEYVTLRLTSLNVSMAQGVLGERYGIDRTTMVRVIDGLEGRSLITREKNEADRRSYRLKLTPRGRKVLSRAKRVAMSVQKDFLSPISGAEWESLRHSLWKLIEENRR